MVFPDEWKNFLERIGLIEATFEAEFEKGELSPDNVLKLRLWASYRGQTLARTGMYISPKLVFTVLNEIISIILLSIFK